MNIYHHAGLTARRHGEAAASASFNLGRLLPLISNAANTHQRHAWLILPAPAAVTVGEEGAINT